MDNFDKIPKSRVYILPNSQNCITHIEGEYTLPNDLTGWILIDEGYGDKYNLAQNHYLEGGLYTMEGVYRYKYKNGACVLRSEDEIAADIKSLPQSTPSQLDKIEAQVTYTAMMTDTLMEG